MPTNINLFLEQAPGRALVFYPGHEIKGTVELTLDSVKSFRGFYVKVFGQARAHWTERESYTTGTGKNRQTHYRTVHYEGKEVYLNSTTYLFGHHGGPSIDIQPGVHRYTFACQLPDQVPYSLEVHHGKIEYYVEVVLDIPWRFDKEIKTPFTIVRYDDLSLYPELRGPMKFEEVKTFCCLFCQSGPLMMSVYIPYSGIAKGDTFPIRIAYSNKSNVEVLSTKIKLKRVIICNSQTPHSKSKTSTDKMVEVAARGVKEDEVVDFDIQLDVPGIMMQSNGRFCRTVIIEYFIEVEGLVDGCHSNPEVSFPVTIGSSLNQMIGQTQPFVEPSAPFVGIDPPYNPSMPSTIPMMQPSAPDVERVNIDLPPSFDEAIKMPVPNNTSFMIQPTTSNLGWNVTDVVPSAPKDEKC